MLLSRPHTLQGDAQKPLDELQGALAAYLPSNERVVWLAEHQRVRRPRWLWGD